MNKEGFIYVYKVEDNIYKLRASIYKPIRKTLILIYCEDFRNIKQILRGFLRRSMNRKYGIDYFEYENKNILINEILKIINNFN